MPPFVLVLMFAGGILLPIAGYLYWAHPAWSWLYFVDPAAVPDLILVLVILVQCSAVVAAWYLGAYLLQTGNDRLVLYGIAGSAVLSLVLGAVFAGRLAQYGTFAEYEAGDTSALLEVKLGYVLIALVLGIATAAGYVGVELVRNSRRVRAR